ncbi:MipA/OmpV family protein [Undibacterium terreum]|uniref:Uncharacterized protein n=1 Tax=Undibacterium terreum TaxID=1224302 RepID=A0A916U370_9BURK|nr:MipA/OmpV family protein [Undibacterium terreum]GGC58813.1 hypothetical protein GCM10011396_02170 [Undibacterium terreum]
MKKILCSSLCSVLLLGVFSAHAQTSDFAQFLAPNYVVKNTDYSLGAAIPGFSRNNAQDERRPTGYLAFSGFGYNFSKDAGIQYGLQLSAETVRDLSRPIRSHGVLDSDTTLESGAFFNYVPSPNYALVSSVRYGSGLDRNGVQLSLGGLFNKSLGQKHQLSASVGANWANSNYQQSYFGVNAVQSANSGYSQFSPSAGLTDIRLGAAWNWNIDSNWSLTTGASLKHLMGDAARSPFVSEKNPVSVFSAATYRF